MNIESAMAHFPRTIPNTLLVEVGTEELPANGLNALAHQFKAAWCKQLSDKGYHAQATQIFCTPRRLAVLLTHLSFQPNPQQTWLIGPAKSHSWTPEGHFSFSAQQWAKRLGIDLTQTCFIEHQGKARLAYQRDLAAPDLQARLAQWLQDTLLQLTLPKKMYWGNTEDWKFLRPIRWVVILIDQMVALGDCFGCPITRYTLGQRRLGNGERIVLDTAAAYSDRLEEQGQVIACFEKRRAKIVDQLAQQADQLAATVCENFQLTEEVVGLTENPEVGCGQFSEIFLTLPEPLLCQVLAEHQRAYLVRSQKTATLLPYFLFVSNLPVNDQIIKGNERVVQARLQDAQFFYEQDRTTGLHKMHEALASLLVHEQLGTQLDKIARLTALGQHLAKHLRLDTETLEQAIRWCKTDLASQLVIEYPALAGTMGAVYAASAGFSAEVCDIIGQHLHPLTGQSALPRAHLAVIISLIDKLDHLVGWFGVGQKPTAQKDPFALRRCAIGMIRLLVEKQLPINLALLVQAAYAVYPAGRLQDNTISEVLAFLYQRFYQWLSDQGVNHELTQAKVDQPDPALFDQYLRLKRLALLTQSGAFSTIHQANKRLVSFVSKHIPCQLSVPEADIASDWHCLEADNIDLPRAAQGLCTLLLSSPQSSPQSFENALKVLFELAQALHRLFDEVLMVDALKQKPHLYWYMLLRSRRLLNQFGHLEGLSVPKRVET